MPSSPPILDHKDADAPSVFAPAALLREARRQKGLAAADVPAICILDPDGDILRRLKRTGQAKHSTPGLVTTRSCTPSRWLAKLSAWSAARSARHSRC